MKQHAAISAAITVSRGATASLASSDRCVTFPDTCPPSPNRLAEWGRALGMEAFIDSSSSSSTNTVVLGGKVLVLDIDIDGHIVVKTSFVGGNNIPSSKAAAPDLDAFLSREVSRWVEAAKRASAGELSSSDMEDPSVDASLRARALQDHLRYLLTLDSLATGEGERGIRWFMEAMAAYQYFTSPAIHHYPTGSKMQPLDKKLAHRAHPIPYLDSPSLSFLVWLSPLAYLRLLRSSPPEQLRSTSGLTDIPPAHLKTSLLNNTEGATIAALKLVASSGVLSAGDTPEGQNDHVFPCTSSHSWVLDFTSAPGHSHSRHNGVVVSQTRMRAIQSVLGVDVAADMLGGPIGSALGSMGSFGSVPGMGQLGFNGFSVPTSQTASMGNTFDMSWLDMLLNTGTSAEYYKAIYHSPSNMHPPLCLRVLAPQEAGFVLERVPVKTAHQVTRILEIVREQCWLNELLLMLPWEAETVLGPTAFSAIPLPLAEETNGMTSEAFLASILGGTCTPASIPVSVYLPSASLPPLAPSQFGFGGLGSVSGDPSGGDSLFGAGDMDMDMEIPGLSMSMSSSSMDMGIDGGMGMSVGGMGSGPGTPARPPAMIILSSPARPPGTGLVELRASFVQGSGGGECGVKMECLPGVETRGMDEVVRRGGVWGLPGRVWVKSHR